MTLKAFTIIAISLLWGMVLGGLLALIFIDQYMVHAQTPVGYDTAGVEMRVGDNYGWLETYNPQPAGLNK